MRKVILAVLLVPSVALGQSGVTDEQFNAIMGFPLMQQQPAPVYGLPVQPVLPVAEDRGPWGTGYSIVTTTRPKQSLFDRDLVGSETVQRVVPNDGLGQPMKGLDNW
jgi:hypothetical protein